MNALLLHFEDIKNGIYRRAIDKICELESRCLVLVSIELW